MEMKKAGNDFALPAVGLGTWHIGGKREADTTNDAACIDAIRAAIDMGYKHIDTAAMYGAGHCEELVGEAIQTFDRKDLIIATKVASTDLSYSDFKKSVENSLERLGVGYIDLLYIHGPNPNIPLHETMRAMSEIADSGHTKHIAVSNFTVELMKEAQELTNHKIVANQVQYNLATRNTGTFSTGMESEILPYCQKSDVLLVAYMPVDRGSLLLPHPLIDELTLKYNVSRAQLAINWLISQENVVTIPKSINQKHLKENLDAASWRMEEDDIERLRNEFRPA